MDSALPTIAIGSDHAGFGLKKVLAAFLREKGYKVIDKGPASLALQDDYPDFIAPVAREVSAGKGKVMGVVIGGSGNGEAITANRFRGVRAAVYYGPLCMHTGRAKGPYDIARLSREHNDANVLSLGARFISEDEAKDAVMLWLTTPFSKEERHVRRIEKIEKLTKRLWRFG